MNTEPPFADPHDITTVEGDIFGNGKLSAIGWLKWSVRRQLAIPGKRCVIYPYGNSNHFGDVTIDQKNFRAHRTMYALAHNLAYTLPGVTQVRQTCKVKRCVNIHHLINGTPAESHCKRGHEWTDTSTYVSPSGSRACRICKNDLLKGYRAKLANNEPVVVDKKRISVAGLAAKVVKIRNYQQLDETFCETRGIDYDGSFTPVTVKMAYAAQSLPEATRVCEQLVAEGLVVHDTDRYRWVHGRSGG